MNALYQVLPIVAVILFLVATVTVTMQPTRSWIAPAGISAVFLSWTAYTALAEGPFGFWPNHTQNAWGNQVWFDLLIAFAVGWALLLPRARAAGMRAWPWLIFIATSGCIGLAAMYARCLYLEAPGKRSS